MNREQKPKPTFEERYVLAEGYPWALVLGRKGAQYNGVIMCNRTSGTDFREIEFPGELWSTDVPKYRLVLERIE